MAALRSTVLELALEELERDLDEVDKEMLERLLELELLRRELLELELLERELLELEEVAVAFFRPGTRIFLSFNRTFLSSKTSSSSLRLMTFMTFSAALSPT